jgi:pimeloyl-ACP methyl ester carboxylesterase
VGIQVLDLLPNEDDFTRMRTSRLLDDIATIIDFSGVKELVVVGSSFGGLLGTWLAHLAPARVQKLILLAPALRWSAQNMGEIFKTDIDTWKKRGTLPVFHYRFNRKVPLAYAFVEDLARNPPPNFFQSPPSCPTLIIHGSRDESVPLAWSQEYAQGRNNVILRVVESDHQMLSRLEEIWQEIRTFLGIQRI